MIGRLCKMKGCQLDSLGCRFSLVRAYMRGNHRCFSPSFPLPFERKEGRKRKGKGKGKGKGKEGINAKNSPWWLHWLDCLPV